MLFHLCARGFAALFVASILLLLPSAVIADSSFYEIANPRGPERRLISKALNASARKFKVGCFGATRRPALAVQRSASAIKVVGMASLLKAEPALKNFAQSVRRECTNLPNIESSEPEYVALFPLGDNFVPTKKTANVAQSLKPAICTQGTCPSSASAPLPLVNVAEFDGIDDRFIAPPVDVDVGRGITLGAFFQFLENSKGTIISKVAPRLKVEYWSLGIYQKDGQSFYRFSLRTGNALKVIRAPITAAIGDWVLINGVYDPKEDQMSIYQNGEVLSSRQITGLIPEGARAPLVMGSHALRSSSYYAGSLGLVGVITQALSPAYLANVYSAFLAGGKFQAQLQSLPQLGQYKRREFLRLL